MNVFITGGAGYVGRYVIPALLQANHRVTALARSTGSAEQLTAMGSTVVTGDVTESGAWMSAAADADAIIHLACPSRKASRGAFTWHPFPRRFVAMMEQLEARALPLLFDVARRSSRCSALITTTGPSAAGNHGDAWVDEDAVGKLSLLGRTQHMVEQRTLESARSGVPAMVIRPGAVYGPDGGFAARILRQAERGRLRYAGSGRNFISWIHIQDYAAAYVHALQGGAIGKVVAIVDDEPLRSREGMELLASLTGAAAPTRVPTPMVRLMAGPVITGWATQSARQRNDRAKTLLGWAPRFRSVREGFPEVLKSRKSSAKDATGAAVSAR
jgi:nucleoside-diphosphate-sugar epimerase